MQNLPIPPHCETLYGIDFNYNEKQRLFYEKVMQAAVENAPYRYFIYGGAVRGGKTFVCLTLWAVLARLFPGSRWLVVRDTLTNLKTTTLPSLKRILAEIRDDKPKWHKNPGEFRVEFENGAMIQFFAESFKTDKDLDRWKGLECNGVLFEQIEEIQRETWLKGVERAGSWLIPEKQPPPILLATCNPAANWVKDEFYLPHARDELEPPYFYLQALPSDNPYVTPEQWASWANLDPLRFQRFIGGDWDVSDTQNLFAYQFAPEKHVSKPLFLPEKPVYLSFDFNVNPACATAWQTDEKTFAHCIAEFSVENCNVYKMAAVIKNKFQNVIYFITGDATGRNRNFAALETAYAVLERELSVNPLQNHTPAHNPLHRESHVFINAFLQHFSGLAIDPACELLIRDLETVRIDPVSGQINKKDPKRGHLLDTFRYFVHTYFGNFARLAEI